MAKEFNAEAAIKRVLDEEWRGSVERKREALYAQNESAKRLDKPVLSVDSELAQFEQDLARDHKRCLQFALVICSAYLKDASKYGHKIDYDELVDDAVSMAWFPACGARKYRRADSS